MIKSHIFPASVTTDHGWTEWIEKNTKLLEFANQISELLSNKRVYPTLCGPAMNGLTTPVEFVNWPHRYHGTFVVDAHCREEDAAIVKERMANNPHNDVHTKVIQPYAIGIDADWVSNLLLPLWKELPCLHDILINAWHADIVNFRAFFGRAIADFGNAIYVIVPVHTDIADSIDVNTGKKRAFSLMISYDMYYPLNRVYLINGTPDEILNCPGRRHWAQSWDFDNKTYRDSIIEITPGITDKISRGLAWHPFDIIHHYSTIATAIGVGLSGTIVKKENMRVEPTLSAEIY